MLATIGVLSGQIRKKNKKIDRIQNDYNNLQADITENHSDKQKHINQLKYSIQELNAINNTRKIQRSNFTRMNMSKYYIANIVSVIFLVIIIFFWAKMTSNLSTKDGISYTPIGIVYIVAIIIIIGFLLVNAFGGQNVRDQMKKDSYLYKFPQY